jgi:hypothetical protein
LGCKTILNLGGCEKHASDQCEVSTSSNHFQYWSFEHVQKQGAGKQIF